MSMRRQKFLLFRVYKFQDTRAYGQLYDLYFDKLYRYIFFKLPNSGDAEELTSEVFLRGWEYATSSQVDHAGALFYRIARNLIADFYRKRDFTEPIENNVDAAVDDSLAQMVETKLESDAMIAHLQTLKEEYRDVLVMRYLNEMTAKEIGVILEKSPNNVRVLIYRAKNALREIISNERTS